MAKIKCLSDFNSTTHYCDKKKKAKGFARIMLAISKSSNNKITCLIVLET